MKYLLYFFLLANLVLYLWHGAVPKAETAHRPPAEVREQRLQLLAELSPTDPLGRGSVDAGESDPSAVRATSEDELTADDMAGVPSAPSCYTLGPFDDERQGDAYSRLRELAEQVQQRQITEQEQYGYQVFIPPLTSLVRARRIAAELKQQGLTDYFIMTGENNRNGISLGLFREKRYASRHLAVVRKKGFEATMEPRYRERVRYWFNYRDDGNRVDENILRELTAGRPIQRLQHDCRGLV